MPLNLMTFFRTEATVVPVSSEPSSQAGPPPEAKDVSADASPFGSSSDPQKVVGHFGGSAASSDRKQSSRMYYVDSGASFHIVSLKDLTARERRRVGRLDTPQPLNTANGATYAYQTAEIYVRDLGVTVNALILGDSPPLLSLGKLCAEHGLRYVWEGANTPYIEHIGDYGIPGHKIWCPTVNNVPTIHSVQPF